VRRSANEQARRDHLNVVLDHSLRSGVFTPDSGDDPKMLRTALLVVVAALASTAVALAAPGRPKDPSTLTALVAEWSVVPSEGVVSAGVVRIRVRNLGLEAHELVLTPTARFADLLPLAGERARIRPIGPTMVVAPGQTTSAVFRIRPGSYVLLDNLPWHYWQGAWAAFRAR
jgi:hypothetical protein